VFAEMLRRKVEGIVSLTAAQIALLEAHYSLMVRWNKVLNLTRVEELEEAVEVHYAESLFLGAHLPREGIAIADVGSGAGFPGFPVAVLRPDCVVTLIESQQRKAVFLKEVSRGIGNVRIVAGRGEDVRERFDHVVSRAVSYEDLTGVLQKLALYADILTGGKEPPPALGFCWKHPVVLPWGHGRFLRQGVSRDGAKGWDVSRETR
jgi:16S rRNA (guanine(527)-N(7))-methyltransferase RsmG